MSPRNIQPIPTKKPIVPKEREQDPKQRPPGGWADTDGLSGEGADSAMEQLRVLEQTRRDKVHKPD